MVLKAGWKALHTSEDIPERDYRLKIIEYQGPRKQRDDDVPSDFKWLNEYVKIAIIDKPVEAQKSANCGERPDKEVIGRRNKIYLGNEERGHNFGYRDLSMALKLDGDHGIDGADLEGLEFDGSWFKKDGYENVKPVIDWDWISAEEADGTPGRQAKGSKKKAGSKRPKPKGAPRRTASRSR